MGRIRTIKPEFPKSESVGRLSRDARLLFLQLLTYVDDHGRGRAHPRLLAGELYPYDDDVRDLLPAWLDELCAEGIALVYQVGGTQFLQILNWAKHQRVDNAGKSLIPPPPEAVDEPSRPVGESPRAAASPREESEVRREPPRTAASRRESPQAAAVRGLDLGPRTMDLGPRTNTDTRERDPGAGSTVPEHPDPDPSPDRRAEPPCEPAADDGGATPCEQDRAAKPRPRQVPRYDADPRFVAAWAAYGRDAAKKQAWDQWQKLMPNDELAAEILAGIRRMVAARPEAKYRPDMHRWLRDFRWTEHPPAETAPRPATRFMQHHSEVPAQRLLPDGSLDDGWDEYDEQVARRKG